MIRLDRCCESSISPDNHKADREHDSIGDDEGDSQEPERRLEEENAPATLQLLQPTSKVETCGKPSKMSRLRRPGGMSSKCSKGCSRIQGRRIMIEMLACTWNVRPDRVCIHRGCEISLGTALLKYRRCLTCSLYHDLLPTVRVLLDTASWKLIRE